MNNLQINEKDYESIKSKYIALIIETNGDIDYLETKVIVGGGYYEFAAFRLRLLTSMVSV